MPKVTKEQKNAKIQGKIAELFDERLVKEISLDTYFISIADNGQFVTAKDIKAKQKELATAMKVLDKALNLLTPAPKAPKA